MLEITYATTKNVPGNGYPERYLTELEIKFTAPVDGTPLSPTGQQIVSSTVQGDTLTVVGTHRMPGALYGEVVKYLKKMQVVPFGYEPPILSAVPVPWEVELTTPGPSRSAKRIAA